MNYSSLNASYAHFGRVTCYMTFILGIFYATITTIGLLSITTPDEPIGNPYFTIMEVSSILIALLMAVSMTAVHFHASREDKIYSFVAVILMFAVTVITSSVHFSVLTIGQSTEMQQLPHYSLLFSFKWPSVVYALDILAWDFFYGLSVLFAVPVFRKSKLEKRVQMLLVISGALSLLGLAGVLVHNMQIRNIGILGYAIFGPAAFLLIGKVIIPAKAINSIKIS